MKEPDLSARRITELFALYRAILRELRHRNVIRTENAPAGDYAEYLVASLTKGELADNSEKSWDIMEPSGGRLQVKCRVVVDSRNRGQRQLSPFRSFDFDETIVVLLNENYGVFRAVRLPVEIVREHSQFRKHVNGHVLHATDEILGHPSATDITDVLDAVASSIP